MSEEKNVLSMRVPESLNNTIYAIAKDKGITATEVSINLMKIGLENSKQFSKEVDDWKNLFIKKRLHDFEDQKLKITMKERFLLSNFKKLTVELRGKTISNSDRKLIMIAGLERLKKYIRGRKCRI